MFLNPLIKTHLQTDMDQLTQIMKVTGVPGPEFVQKLDSPEVGTQYFSLRQQLQLDSQLSLVCNTVATEAETKQ